MPTPGTGGPTAQVSFVLDPASVNRLVNDISVAFTKAMAGAGAVFQQQMVAMGKAAVAGISVANTAAQTHRKTVINVGAAYAKLHSNQNAYLTTTSRNVIKETQLMRSLGDSIQEVVAELKKSGALQRQEAIAAIRLSETEGRLQVENVKNTGRLQFVEGQKNLVQVRENAKRRLLITQQLFQHLVRLEKTLGTGIAGAARGLSAGFSKVFTSVRSLFSKNNEEITAGFRKNGQAVERGLKRGNTVFNEGLNESLNKRERALQSSFTQQEHIVRRSVLRQEEQLTKLRTQTSKGVLGAVTGRGVGGGLGLGSLFGGLGLIGALTSTFTIGAEFTKGLAVLQAQLGLTGEQMKGVRALSVQLGNDISLPGVSALDAAQAIQTLTKTFGYLGPAAVDAAEKAAKGTLQLAIATGSSAEDSAAIIGAAVNVFKIGADQAVSVADSVAVAISKAAGVSFTDFKDSFTQGATVFEQFVGPAEDAKHVIAEFSTALAVLARSGITGENAGAGLKQFFIQGNKEGKKSLEITAEIVKRAGTTGKIFFDSAGNARTFADSIDILRKGLVGLTDQQKASTLSTLFGSRSLTIANALVNTSAEEFLALEGAMNRQGAAAAIAKAANTGLKGAFDALKSVIETVQIVFYEKVQKPLGQAVLWFAALTNEILFSNGAWHLFRRAILGVVVAVGAVIALKGAIETIKLLGTVLTALTTPFGAILVVAALAGAAIALMTDNTSKLGASLRGLTAPLLEGFGSLIGAKPKEVPGTEGHAQVKQAVTLTDVFTRLKFILTKDVIPAVRDAAAWIGTHLVEAFKVVYHFIADVVIPIVTHFGGIVVRDLIGAFRATVRFFENVLIPGFKTVVGYITDHIGPVISRVATWFSDAFTTAAGYVVSFWRTVKPYLDPLIDGFSALGKGIASIVTGDFSNIGSGFVAAGKGIAGTVAKTAISLADALHPVVNRIGQFFTDLFSADNIKKYIKGALDFINTLGLVLGRIVSDPRVVKTIAVVGAVLVAAAVKIAFEFITGFFQGVMENLPKLFAMASAALTAGFKKVFSNIGVVLAAVVGAIALGPTLARLFRGAGASAGDGFLAGLKTKAGNAKGALSGFFGTASGLGSASLRAGHVNEITGLNNQLRVLGGQSPFLDLRSSTRQIEEVQTKIERLRGPLTDAQLRGLKVRDAFRQAGVAAKGIGSGLGTAAAGAAKFFGAPLVNGIKAALSATNAYTGPATSGARAFAGAFKSSLAAGADQFKAGLKGAFGALQEFAKSQGITTGQAFGHALGKAAIGAAAAIGGFVAGKAEGEQGGSGIISALLGGVATGALIGGGFGAAVGIVTAGAGLIGAAFGRAGKKAKEFRDQVKGLVEEFRGPFIEALNAGKIKADGITFEGVVGAIDLTQVQKDLTESLSKLTGDQAKVIGGLRLNIAADIIPVITRSGGSAEKAARDLTAVLGERVRNSPQFKALFGDVASGAQAFEALRRALLNGSPAQKKYAADVRAVKDNMEGYVRAAVTAIGINKDLGFSFSALPNLKDVGSPREHVGVETLDTNTPFTTAATKLIAAVTPQLEASVKTWQALIKSGLSVDEANAELAKLKFPPIPQEAVAAWEKGLEGIDKKAQVLNDQLDAMPGLFAKAFDAANPKTSAPAVVKAQAVLAATDAGAGVGDVATATGIAGAAKQTIAAANLDQVFGDAISAGIKNHTIVDVATARAYMEPIKNAAIDASNAALTPADPANDTPANQQARFAAAVAINAQYEAAFAATGGVVALVTTQLDDQQALDDLAAIRNLMAANPLITEIRARFVIDKANKADAHNASAKEIKGILDNPGGGNAFNLTDFGFPTPAALSTLAAPLGTATVTGIANAIHSKGAKLTVKAAVDDLAASTIANAKGAFRISSPSKIFHGIGEFLVQGLANGITAGAAVASTTAATMAQSVIDAAQGVLDGGLTPPSVPPVNAIPSGAIPSAALPQAPRANLTTIPPAPEQDAKWAAQVAAITKQVDIAEQTKAFQNAMDTATAVITASQTGMQDAFTRGAGAIETAQTGIKDALAEGRRVAQLVHATVTPSGPPAGHDKPLDIPALAKSFGSELARRPEVTNVNITEAANARATARSAIAELRAERMLRYGLR